jgi:tetratricopeptide (TPR) repeat protein
MYAFLVGVGDYDAKELRPLKYTQNDIREFYQAIVESGFSQDNVVLMHDEAKRRYQPEAKKIREELALLLARLEKDDTIIVALAGHGVQFKGEKTAYFCPVDAQLKDRQTLLSLDTVYRQLQKCKAGRKLLLVDACRNDPQSKVSRSRAEVELETLTRLQKEPVPRGIVALFSCSAGEESFEHPELKHGLFFYNVLQAWKGEADGGDGTLTLDDLVAYVKKETRKYAQLKLRAIQTPEVKGEYGIWVLKKIDLGMRLLKEGKAIMKAQERAGYLDREGIEHWIDGLRRASWDQRAGTVNGDAVQRAIDKFNRVIRLRPGNAQAYKERAAAYRFLREYDRAVGDYSEAIRIDPSFAEALLERAYVYSVNDDRTKAIADYQEVLAVLHPKNAQTYTLRGQAYRCLAYYGKRTIDSAIDHFTEAIRLDPKNSHLYVCRGRTYASKKAPDKTLADFVEAVRLNPKNVEALLARAGVCQWGSKDFDQAVAFYNQAIRFAPKDPYLYCCRGHCFSMMKDSDKTIADYSEAIRLDPKDGRAYQDRTSFYTIQKDYNKAIADCTEAIRFMPKHPHCYMLRASAYLLNGDRTSYEGDWATYQRLTKK